MTTEDKILDLYTVFPNEHQNYFFLRLVLKICMLGFLLSDTFGLLRCTGILKVNLTFELEINCKNEMNLKRHKP